MTIASAFLVWFELQVGSDSPLNNDYSGVELMLRLGAILLVIGAMLVMLGFLLLRAGPGGRRGLAIAALVPSAIAALLGAIAVVQPGSSLARSGADRVADDYGLPAEADVAQVIADAEETNDIRVKPGVGSMVALGGGIFALLGAAIETLRSSRGQRPHPGSEADASPAPTAPKE